MQSLPGKSEECLWLVNNIMFENIQEDIKIVCVDKNLVNYIKVTLLSHSIHMILLFRFGHYCGKSIPFLGKIIRIIIEYYIRIIYASDISCKANIGKGFNIAHGHDIVIGSNVIIGNYCKIFNGVTLGNKYTETTNIEQPILENNVIISTGAKVLGNITIGANSIVGANSVVINDIPKNSTVIGIPGIVI